VPTTDLLLLALIVLITLVVAARSYMAWGSLVARADRVRLRATALDERTTRLADTFALTRGRLAEVNASLEHGLSRLPRFDEAVDGRSLQLADVRLGLERVRTRDLAAADQALVRIRTVARVVRAAVKLQRSWWA
jgi:hypothetical protein